MDKLEEKYMKMLDESLKKMSKSLDKLEEKYMKMLDESLKKISKSLDKLVKLEEIRTFPKYVNLEESSELKEYKKEDVENE